MEGSVELNRERNGRFLGRRHQCGQSVVEFALIIPIVLLVIVVFIDVGKAYFTNQVILNAAREGARVGILPQGSPAKVIVAVNSVMTSGGLSGHTIAHSNVGAGVPAGFTTKVTVTYPFKTLTGTFVPGWTGTINLDQTVQMRHE